MATKVLFPPASFPSPLLQASNILPGPHPCLSCTTFLGCSLSVTSLLHYLSQDTHKDKYPRIPHSPPLGSLTSRSFLSSQQKCHGEEDHTLPQQVWSSLRTTAMTKSHTSSPAVPPSGPTAFPSATSRILPIQATPSYTEENKRPQDRQGIQMCKERWKERRRERVGLE